MIELSEEQRKAVLTGLPVRAVLQQEGTEAVVLAIEQYDRIRELLHDERDQAAWSQLGRKAARRWMDENPF